MDYNKDSKVSKFFTWKEMIQSKTAERENIDNVPYQVVTKLNLIKLANTLDLVRAHIDAPVIINSGYRNAKVNKKVKGVENSLHMEGKAADISFTRKGDYEKALTFLKKHRTTLNIDEIVPYDTYIHVGIY